MSCGNISCSNPNRKSKGKTGYCVSCYEILRRHGFRSCRFCGQSTLANFTPSIVLRHHPEVVCCSKCADIRSRSWSFLFDKCQYCGRTESKHAANGLCDACRWEFRKGKGKCRQCECSGVPMYGYGVYRWCAQCFVVTYNSIAKELLAGQANVKSIAKKLGVNKNRVITFQNSLNGKIQTSQIRSRRILLPMLDRCGLTRLVLMGQMGDETAMNEALDRLSSKVRRWVHKSGCYLNSGTREDVYQDAMLEVWKGLKLWQANRGMSLEWFAKLCVMRSIATSLKLANRKKHRFLNYAMSLDTPVHDEGKLLHEIVGHNQTPESLIISKYAAEVRERLLTEILRSEYIKAGSLNSRLLDDIHNYPGGQDYKVRANRLGVVVKSIDNTYQRLRRLGEKDGIQALIKNIDVFEILEGDEILL